MTGRTKAQQRAIARTYWRWRFLLGDQRGRGGMVLKMVKRKHPRVSTTSIYEYAHLWRDVFEGGKTLKGVNRHVGR